MRLKLLCAGALAAALGLAAAPVRAEPALWTVKDADSTIYLFGTVHLLRPDRSWMTPKIKAALASCQDLSLEITDGDPVAMAGLMHKYGIDSTRKLSGRLSARDWARLEAAAATLGAKGEQFEPLRPWFAGLQLTLGAVIKAGYAPDAGVENILKAEAATRQEPVAGLETAESQIALLASLPEDVQIDFLRQSLDEFEDAAEVLDEMAEAWETGDEAKLDKMINRDMREVSEALYQKLIVNRNKGFARKLEAKLKGEGTSCVAVGAGHLVGADSVQAQLAKDGVKAEKY